MAPSWYPDWAGQTIVIVASGPSAKDTPVDLARGRARVIAVNSSWQLCPWADLLYGCDFGWWKSVEGCPSFEGLKVSVDYKAHREWGVNLISTRRGDDRMEFEALGTVGWGANSGFQAYNLAVQLKPSKIIFVGFDMTMQNGAHWHGEHPAGLSNPSKKNIIRWRRSVDRPWKLVADRGITVINCSPISTLQRYPKMTLEQALSA